MQHVCGRGAPGWVLLHALQAQVPDLLQQPGGAAWQCGTGLTMQPPYRLGWRRLAAKLWWRSTAGTAAGGGGGSGRPANYWGPAPAQKQAQPQADGAAQALLLTWGHSSGTRSGRMQPREGGSPGAMRGRGSRFGRVSGSLPLRHSRQAWRHIKCAWLPACLPLHTVHSNTPSENMSTACVTWRFPNKSSGACSHRMIGESALASTLPSTSHQARHAPKQTALAAPRRRSSIPPNGLPLCSLHSTTLRAFSPCLQRGKDMPS